MSHTNFHSAGNFWLNIHKPYGYSSAKVVAIVKRLTGAKRVGHAGTLDPLATGVLPIAVNQATKTCQYITDVNKRYYFQIKWGEFRDTDDAEGKAIKSSDKRPATSEIISVLPNFIGKIKQTPPQFSAIKINGKKAYEMARKNEHVDLKSREVTIYDIRLISNNNTHAEFEIGCSKGTYIRSFARDLAEILDSCGYISVLKRLEVGDFRIKNAISLDKLKNIINYAQTCASFLDLRQVLGFMPEIELSDFDAGKVRNGQIIEFSQNFLQQKSELLVKIINNDKVVGLGKAFNNSLKPINIFNNY